MSGETILVVEDNDVLRDGLKVLLEADGYAVTSALHGLDALDRMRQSPPDLILSDITMPEMDGYAFFEAVRSRPEWLSIPFIFLTARRSRDDIFTGKKLGAEDYLVKPVTRQELVTTIRSRLARSQQLLLAQLQQAYDDSLIMLANAIELRDQYTRGHVERVTELALTIARSMGWTASRMNHLQYGSILHDIGKIHIPEAVLRKPGSLSDVEWNEMRKHPLIGVEMVKDIPYLAPAIPVIHYHHERWDGKGYPDGLVGEEIPLVARIVSIADSLDAMTTNRSYHKALTAQEAYDEIVRCSGTRYDPSIVLAFQHAWGEIQAIIQAH